MFAGGGPPQVGSIPVPEKLVSVRMGYGTRVHQRGRNLDGLNTQISRNLSRNLSERLGVKLLECTMSVFVR